MLEKLQLNRFTSEYIADYCRDKVWIFRLPVFLFMLYIFYQHAMDRSYFGFLGNFNLIMHEAGHWIFMLFGETMTILGGTLMQLGVPMICLIAFIFQDEIFGAIFCLTWLADNLFNVAAYMADARARVLPLLGGNVDGHDWYNLFSRWGILNYDIMLAGFVNFLAKISISISIVLAAWLLWKMFIVNKK